MPIASHDLDAVLAQAAEWLAHGQPVGIATVVRTWGSSPRQPGSKLCVNAAGEFVGSVSGGCIEAAVIGEALEVAAGRARPHVLEFGVTDERAWEVGLACGGHIEVFVEAADAGLIAALIAARASKQPIALHTPLDGSPPRIAEARGLEVSIEDGVLVEPLLPPLRLIVVGAVHVALPLAQMAQLAGFAVTIVDPRRAWATAERFPGIALVCEWPDTALQAQDIDTRTAIVALTHDPKLDDPALATALASPAFYIGCLGSKKTHAARRERLAGAGDLERLHGPVGLAIGAKTPAEIAVAILAQIIATLRGAAA